MASDSTLTNEELIARQQILHEKEKRLQSKLRVLSTEVREFSKKKACWT